MSESKNYDKKVKAFDIELRAFADEFNEFVRASSLSEQRMRDLLEDENYHINSKEQTLAVMNNMKKITQKLNVYKRKNPRDLSKYPLDYLYKATEGTDKSAADIVEELTTNDLRNAFAEMQENKDWLWDFEHEYIGELKITVFDTEFQNYIALQEKRLDALHSKNRLETLRLILGKYESTDPYDDQNDLDVVNQNINYYDTIINYVDEVFGKISDRIEASDPALAERLFEEEAGIDMPLMFDKSAMPYVHEQLQELENDDNFKFFMANSDIDFDDATEEVLSRLEEEAGIKPKQNQSLDKRISNYKFEK